jgi:hypothetical protein
MRAPPARRGVRGKAPSKGAVEDGGARDNARPAGPAWGDGAP